RTRGGALALGFRSPQPRPRLRPGQEARSVQSKRRAWKLPGLVLREGDELAAQGFEDRTGDQLLALVGEEHGFAHLAKGLHGLVLSVAPVSRSGDPKDASTCYAVQR